MPTLQRTAEQPDSDVRIVNVSSTGHQMAPKGGLALKEARTDMQPYNTWTRYGQSKLANILFTKELARRYPAIKSMAVHPGGVNSGLSEGFSKAHPWINMMYRPIVSRVFKTPDEGALTQLYAATNKDAKSGSYYVPIAVENPGSKNARDPKLAEELWDWTEKELASRTGS